MTDSIQIPYALPQGLSTHVSVKPHPDPESPQTLHELANNVKQYASALEVNLASEGQPQPSFDANGQPHFAAVSKSQAVQDTRSTLLSVTRTLHDLVLGPAAILEQIHPNDVLCLQVIYRYNVASHFGVDEQVSFEDLSKRCGLNVVDLKRVLRLAMTRRVFCEPQAGKVAYTAASRLLAEDERTRDFAGIVVDERFPASVKTADALIKYGRSKAPNQSGFSLANDPNCGLYEELSKHPHRRDRWTNAMSAMAHRTDFSFLERTFPFSADASGTMIDAGGGDGAVSVGLARRFPNFRFVVQDTPETIRGLSAPDELRSRLEHQAHSFFEPQPCRDADVYYMRNIFHNWPDEQCVQILRNHVPVMRPGSRLLIDDFTLHDPLTVSPIEERKTRSMDITMLIYFGSRERTVGEWREMLAEADERFELIRASRDPRQPNTLLEVGWRDGHGKSAPESPKVSKL